MGIVIPFVSEWACGSGDEANINFCGGWAEEPW